VSFGGNITNDGLGIYIDNSATGTFQDVSFNQHISDSGQGIDASSNNISYYSICGYPPSKVWPGASDQYNNGCFSPS